jgi:signal transduction histidine kinase
MALPTNAVTNETLVRFARRVSHDLNNLTTVVRTYSELLLADLPVDSPLHADISEIHQAAEAMVTYLQRVTRFTRVGSLRRIPVSVAGGVDDAVALFRAAEPGREVRVQSGSGGQVLGDAMWFRDVVAELLHNAHAAAPAGAALELVSTETPTHAVIEVRDEGPGFAELSAEVLEPLVSTKAGIRGAGIGLSLVAGFVDVLGGTLDIRRDGAVTVVAMTLPLAPPGP